jgi:hypothetical protein
MGSVDKICARARALALTNAASTPCSVRARLPVRVSWRSSCTCKSPPRLPLTALLQQPGLRWGVLGPPGTHVVSACSLPSPAPVTLARVASQTGNLKPALPLAPTLLQFEQLPPPSGNSLSPALHPPNPPHTVTHPPHSIPQVPIHYHGRLQPLSPPIPRTATHPCPCARCASPYTPPPNRRRATWGGAGAGQRRWRRQGRWQCRRRQQQQR